MVSETSWIASEELLSKGHKIDLLQDEAKQKEGYKLVVELAGGIDYRNN